MDTDFNMPLVKVSSFDSPDSIWEILTSGKKITFKEYEGTGIPTMTMEMDDLDLITRWEDYPRSLLGLQSALIDNAQRLIEWKYFQWSDKNQHSELCSHYKSLVDKYKIEVSRDLNQYFGVNRNIEAGSNYSRFLIQEKTLLEIFKLGFIFDWNAIDQQSEQYVIRPAIEKMPDHDHEDNNSIKGDGFEISRINIGKIRQTIVEIDDIDRISPGQLVNWLHKNYRFQFNGKSIHKPEIDGFVFGTDAYGIDFCAGNIKNPSSIITSLKESSASEQWQEQ